MNYDDNNLGVYKEIEQARIESFLLFTSSQNLYAPSHHTLISIYHNASNAINTEQNAAAFLYRWQSSVTWFDVRNTVIGNVKIVTPTWKNQNLPELQFYNEFSFVSAFNIDKFGHRSYHGDYRSPTMEQILSSVWRMEMLELSKRVGKRLYLDVGPKVYRGNRRTTKSERALRHIKDTYVKSVRAVSFVLPPAITWAVRS
ncbi:1736_t:CDS:2 [Acaulospora morrowiae]|uniref:1736_t:CDS:1 n=1 Tax=Acaulospora morrowiae TaxID=94023 RepID=A0A9N9DNX5_9GLOM|nr:1736_t:CDS:2 [Acaulospora morrowiae]